MVEKAKQKLLFKNCECFIQEKVMLRVYFCLKVLPGYKPGFISVNFYNFFISGDHLLIAIYDKLLEYS